MLVPQGDLLARTVGSPLIAVRDVKRFVPAMLAELEPVRADAAAITSPRVTAPNASARPRRDRVSSVPGVCNRASARSPRICAAFRVRQHQPVAVPPRSSRRGG